MIDLYLNRNIDFDAKSLLEPLLGEYPDVIDAFLKQTETHWKQQPATGSLARHAWSNGRVRALLDQWWDAETTIDLRSALLPAAGKLAKEDPRWLARILKLINDTDFNAKPAAIHTLGQLVADHPEAERALSDVLTSHEPSMVQAAIGALAPLLRKRDRLRQDA